MAAVVSTTVGETNISILSKIFKENIIGKTTDKSSVTPLYITDPWFNDLFLVFMYPEKKDDPNVLTNNSFNPPPSVDDRRTLYYAKFNKTSKAMELLSNKGFITDHFVKVRALVDELRAVAAAAADKEQAIFDFLQKPNADPVLVNIITDMALLNPVDTGKYNAKNEIFGGKHNKSSKQRKQKKNKGSRKH